MTSPDRLRAKIPRMKHTSDVDLVPCGSNDGPASAPDDSLVREFQLFLREEKRWWLAPLLSVLLLLSTLIVFAEGSAIAPFIYTLF